MLALNGYCDGNNVTVDDKDKNNLISGKVIITFLENKGEEKNLSLAERRKEIISSKRYVHKGAFGNMDADKFVEELRNNDRL